MRLRSLVIASGAALGAALFTLGAVTVVRADGGDTSLIHACQKLASHGRLKLKFIQPTGTCPNGYTPVHWPGGETPLPDISARVFNSAEVSVASDAVVPLAFDSERWDTNGIHDSVNPTRLTAQTAGRYLIVGEAIFGANPTGNRTVFIRRNGVDADVLARVNVPAASTAQATLSRTAVNIAAQAQLGQGDFVELWVSQNSGSSLAVGTPSEGVSEFGMVKVP